MFTEGLDESAINWINQGKETDQVPEIRSPLTEKLAPNDSFPKSPLIYNNTATLLSPHVLPPPLKFRFGLLGPHSVIAPALDDEEDGLDDESVASVSDDGNGNFSDGEDMFERTSKCSSKLIRGFSKLDLKVELPDSNRRFTDDDLGIREFANKNLTAYVGIGGGSFGLRERVQLHNAHGTIPGHANKTFKVVEDLGTPSAPPILDIGREGSDTDMEIEEEFEQIQDEIYKPVQADCFDGSKEGLPYWKSQSLNCPELVLESVNKTSSTDKEEKIPYWQSNMSDDLHHYNASGQYAWQTLIAYDACIRLCLYAWARGCPEAPEFLRDECLLLRSAFGLHKFLLQPQGVQPVEVSTTKSVEQVSLKAKKVLGKIRVEVKKLRIIPSRKLKSVYSQRSAMYMQVGAEYVRQVSSLVKTGMNSLKIASFPVASEEPLSCFFQLKSATEDTKVEPSSTICVHPGCGNYHVFFPETEGDALLVEVQDKKNLVQAEQQYRSHL